MADLVGQQLGNYRLIRLLGQGGFADVYLANHIHLNTMAAIKVLQTRLVGNDIDQFRKEAQVIAHLKHPHIVQVLDFGVENNVPFLIMEYAPNGTLRQKHAQHVPISPDGVVPYVKQIADPLQYAHDQKIIHRDIKPENMLLDNNNSILLSDFGLAITNPSGHSSTKEMVGTVAYMAPEQIQGRPQIASDQYALAIAVYEWLTGARPFNGSFVEITVQHLSAPPPSMHQKVPMLSAEIEEVVFKALSKDPQGRFLSVRAFSNAFEQACLQAVHLSNIPTVATNLPSQSDKLVLTSGGSSTMPTATISTLSGETKKTLLSTTVTIGRSRNNQLVVDDPQVTAHHAEIRPTGQGYVIADLNSTNGTFVNGQRLVGNTPRPLYSNDKIGIGNTTFVYNATGEEPVAGIPMPPMPGPAWNNPQTGNIAQSILRPDFPHDAPTVVRPVLGASSPRPIPEQTIQKKASRLPLYVLAVALAVILIIAIPLLSRAFAHPGQLVVGTTTPTTPLPSPSPTPTDTATPSPTPTDTPSPTATDTPTPMDTPVPQQDIAGIHNGYIYILYNGNYYKSNLQLTIYQSGGNISGYCVIGSANGTFRGMFDNISHQLSFTCNISSTRDVFQFLGFAPSNGNLQGTYKLYNTYGNYIAGNNWNTG